MPRRNVVPRHFRRLRRLGRAALAAALLLPAPALAQGGTGSSGAAVLQLPAGSRAYALSGAYVAASGDADALFYNPAGAAGLGAAASLAYHRHVMDIDFGSVAGALEAGPFVIGLAVTYLNGGDIEIIEPDPNFGGQRGRETGEFTSARESAARLALAAPLGRLSVGAAAGVVTSSLAGVTRSAPLVDIGAQFELPIVTIGASLRNLGPALSGDGGADVPLPTEARVGARFERELVNGLGFTIGADLASDLEAGTTWLAAGIEAGLLPGGDRMLGAVARVSMDGDARGEEELGALRLGAGFTFDRLAFDYTYQEFEYFGAIHRIGFRWARPPR